MASDPMSEGNDPGWAAPRRRATDEAVVARLREHVGSCLPPEAVPTHFVFVDDLPTLPNGKVDRGALARRAPTGSRAAGPPPGAVQPSGPGEAPNEGPVEATDGAPDGAADQAAAEAEAPDDKRPDDSGLLARMFASELSRRHVGPDEELTRIGVNSLMMVRVCAAWTARTGRHVDGARLARKPTIRDIIAHASAAGAAEPVDGLDGRDGLDGLDVKDHRFDVPLDHDDPDGPAISLFARTVRRSARPGRDLPYLLFLQGGPGGQCPDPRNRLPVWMDVALDHYQVVLLDQRGGGRSSALTPDAIAGLSAAEAAEHLRRFRADSVVRDAEVLRERVLKVSDWTLLGESYGGSIALTYLSLFPIRIDRVLISSGLFGPVSDAESVLRATLATSRRKNAEYYDRYPDDMKAVARIVTHLTTAEVRLPTGERLTPERFAMLGLKFGFDGGMASLHDLLGTAWDGDGLAEDFLSSVATTTVFTTSPLFYLQEYTYGVPGHATGWTAQRLYADAPDFGPDATPFSFYGEVFFPWMFQQIAALRPFAEVADELARFTRWNSLYDRERLRRNTVPIHAVAVADDLYVPLDEQIRTARDIGCCWLTISPAPYHAALMNDREAFSRLLSFAGVRNNAEGQPS